MTSVPFDLSVLEYLKEFLKIRTDNRPLTGLVVPPESMDTLKTFLENFFSQFFQNEMQIEFTDMERLYRDLSGNMNVNQELKPVVRSVKNILFLWHDIKGSNYIENKSDFDELIAKLIPKMLAAMITYLRTKSYAKHADELEKLLIIWRGRA